MAEHNDLGREGEGRAADYLAKKGYQILERNYTFNRAEVDLICIYKEELVIVEVKTRQSDYLAGPEDTVNLNKQKSIIRAANNYIQEEEIDLECRFDIVSIILNQKAFQLEHIEGAFWPTN